MTVPCSDICVILINFIYSDPKVFKSDPKLLSLLFLNLTMGGLIVTFGSEGKRERIQVQPMVMNFNNNGRQTRSQEQAGVRIPVIK